MNVLSVPRTAATLEYKVLTLPAHLMQTRLVARFLTEDNAVRLGYQRALGELDARAGRLLADERLARRGEVAVERAEALARARLVREAQASEQEPDERLQAEQREAAEKRRKARRKRADDAATARAEGHAAEQGAVDSADAEAEAQAGAVDVTVDSALVAERERLDEAEKTIQRRTEARTAAPEAQLDEATEVMSVADRERDQAEHLGELADEEKQERVRAREQRLDTRRTEASDD